MTLRTVACQAPLSIGFSRQECWSGLPFPPPGDLPDPGIKPESPASPASPALEADSLPLSHLGRPYYYSTTAVPILWMRTLRRDRLSDELRSQTREQRGYDLNPRTQARVHSLNTASRAFSYSLSSLLNKSKTCQEDMLTPFCRRGNESLGAERTGTQLELAPGLLTPHTGPGTKGPNSHPSVGQVGTTQQNKKDGISPH